MVEWLLNAGCQRIVLLDNQSTYPPLLRFYEDVATDTRLTIIRLPGNFGHMALWTSGILRLLGWQDYFAYSDPDILPDNGCPLEFLDLFVEILESSPTVMKAGFGLIIDDIPDQYRFKTDVITWEQPYWEIPVGPGLYAAPIDTTFALYRGDAALWDSATREIAKYRSVRTGTPYLARHLDWYLDSDNPTEEQQFYRNHAIPGVTSWSLENLPQNVISDLSRLQKGERAITKDEIRWENNTDQKSTGILKLLLNALVSGRERDSANIGILKTISNWFNR